MMGRAVVILDVVLEAAVVVMVVLDGVVVVAVLEEVSPAELDDVASVVLWESMLAVLEDCATEEDAGLIVD